MERPGFDPRVERTPEEGMVTHSVFLPRESHGQRAADYSPWGCKRSGA